MIDMDLLRTKLREIDMPYTSPYPIGTFEATWVQVGLNQSFRNSATAWKDGSFISSGSIEITDETLGDLITIKALVESCRVVDEGVSEE